MEAWLDDGDIRLYHGDALEVLRSMPDESVDCVVTSPPYWSLRDYQVDGQLGLEATPDLFVAGMVDVFREVRRVLAKHGTCWVNLGDSYSGGKTGRADQGRDIGGRGGNYSDGSFPVGEQRAVPPGMKPKDLVGIPWRVAFALQQDGWWLRSDIIWAKPNPMPESVTDRPTKAHEYLFLLTKQPRYWFDTEAVREAYEPDGRKVTTVQSGNGAIGLRGIGERERWAHGGRNVRSVWTIATQPYPEAHFATFPEELARRAILAGCPLRVCRVCGKPSERIVEAAPDKRVPYATEGAGVKAGDAGRNDGKGLNKVLREDGRGGDLATIQRTTVGWSDCGCERECGSCLYGYPTACTCDRVFSEPSSEQREITGSEPRLDGSENKWRPGVVLDPFIGSGTTAKVARDHQRHAIGIDLSSEYLELAARRLQQLSLLT